jgi:hypothetical protein
VYKKTCSSATYFGEKKPVEPTAQEPTRYPDALPAGPKQPYPTTRNNHAIEAATAMTHKRPTDCRKKGLSATSPTELE